MPTLLVVNRNIAVFGHLKWSGVENWNEEWSGVRIDFFTNIGVFVKINHSSNDPCPHYWLSIEILPFSAI